MAIPKCHKGSTKRSATNIAFIQMSINPASQPNSSDGFKFKDKANGHIRETLGKSYMETNRNQFGGPGVAGGASGIRLGEERETTSGKYRGDDNETTGKRFCTFCLRYKRLGIWTDTTPAMSHGMSDPWRIMRKQRQMETPRLAAHFSSAALESQLNASKLSYAAGTQFCVPLHGWVLQL